MTFTTPAWPSPHVSTDIQSMPNPRHFPSFPARQHSYTLVDHCTACVLLLPLPRSFFHAFFRFHPPDRRLKTRRHKGLCSNPQNEIVVTLGSIWFRGPLFSLFP